MVANCGRNHASIPRPGRPSVQRATVPRMTYAALAPLTAAIAFALALGFHRNRAALMFLVMMGVAFATVTEEARDLRGATAFAPWLLFAAALLPEARIV